MFDKSQPAFTELRNIVSERTSPILVWVGAGASREVGIPTWPELANALHKALIQKADTLQGAEKTKTIGAARAIEKIPNLWTRFQRYREQLGKTTYRATILEKLGSANTVSIPDVYHRIWRIPSLRGVLNLNIDRLATRAYTDAYPGRLPIEFNGWQCGEHAKHLSGNNSFIANLHGSYEDESSWVFTDYELTKLLSDPGYTQFVNTCLTAFRIVFVGISTDDLAVGGHLQRLTHLGISTAPHYWVTHRADRSTDQYAEALNVRCITYPLDAPHTGLHECLDALAEYIPGEEDAASPAFQGMPASASDDIPAPEDIVRESNPENIRATLNAKAVRILQSESEEAHREYDRFCERYEQAIHQAWFVSLRPGRNEILGHRLIEEIGNGAFSTVYRAETSDGGEVALKLLRQDVRRDAHLLHSFRRGVRSMRILSERGVDGMVAYYEASEIPTFVTMELIEGPDLTEAVKAHQFENWHSVLWVASHIVRVVREAHTLPERVLHRDLRPANVMIRNLYSEPDEAEVVVLDFDLSWHKGAVEKSIYHPTMLGYLAPEQVRGIKDVSTRSALVDSFGMGMTFFFLVSREEPLAESHVRPEWSERVWAAASRLDKTTWISLGARFARLILSCTQEKQTNRPDSTAIEYEIGRLISVAGGDVSDVSAEMWAEEVMARSEYCAEMYQWSSDEFAATAVLRSGVRVKLEGKPGDDSVRLVADWGQVGTEDRKKVGKWIAPAAENVREMLLKRGWKVNERPEGRGVIHLDAVTRLERTSEALRDNANTVDRVIDRLRFE